MSQFINFLLHHYREIILVILLVLEIVLIVIKKRPKVVDTSLVTKLMEWIAIAEATYKNGRDKLDFVLSCASSYLGDLYVEADIKKLVEFILSLPQKKD